MANPEGRAGLLYARDATSGEITSFNLYRNEIENGNGPIFTNGRNQGYNLGLNGGTDAARYYMSLSYDNDVGIVDWNWDRKVTARANVDAGVGSKLRLQGNVAFIRDRIRLAQSAIDIDPFSNLVWGTPRTRNLGQRGFSTAPPEVWSQAEGHADTDRTTVSLTAKLHPGQLFHAPPGDGARCGRGEQLDPVSAPSAGEPRLPGQQRARVEERRPRAAPVPDARLRGDRQVRLAAAVRLRELVRPAALPLRAEHDHRQRRHLPGDPDHDRQRRHTRQGAEDYTANATVGVFLQQSVAWKNRLFLTAAIRGDDNSAFGEDFKAAYYPKFSGSWC
jgi:hypothetical protein